jgi:predicted MFS family arabinose efflux permease
VFYGWTIVGITFATQFVAMGCIFYCFSVVLKPLAVEFGGGGRFGVTLIPVALSLAGAFTAPVIGRLVARGSIRNIMTVGCMAVGVGFLALSQATELWQLYLVYGTLFAIGFGTMANIATSALVVNWFARRRSTALGISQIGTSSSGIVLVPVAAWLLANWGWRGAFAAFGGAALCLAPAVWLLVVGHPEERGLLPDDDPSSSEAAPHAGPAANLLTTREALREWNLWVISLVCGLLFMVATALITHVVAFATDAGFSEMRAAYVLSAIAGGAAAGKLVFGWLADRTSERISLATAIALQIVALIAMMNVAGYGALVTVALVFGLGLGATLPLVSALLARAFGRDAFAAMLGLMTPILIPFQASGAPFAAWVFDTTGSYDLAFWAFVVALGMAAAALILVRLSAAETAESPVAAAASV